ncbi:Methyltransferase-like protein [Hondaea fermentalgiana]|uniref:Methyltransferase-like protein n=1 Tax=Hondaea fermentalgiana TaxID=2315210 RepID=A0A2R5GFF7_9STRA|nr:Methyltransferase-like protein [Hondaea fermentalgiana]|eukprot:GBG28498.1 Methyltransferase-like protein [Hondaea fermentalgiana]
MQEASGASGADNAWTRSAALVLALKASLKSQDRGQTTIDLIQNETLAGAHASRSAAAKELAASYAREEDIDDPSTQSSSPASSEGEVFWHVEEFVADHEDQARDAVVSRVGIAMEPSQIERLEREAAKHWDIFYKRNTTNFFKDRHYLTKAFPVLREKLESGEPCKMVEFGCGVGNAILPLAETYKNCLGFGVDFSDKAIALLNERKHPRCRGFVDDITGAQPLPAELHGANLASLLFVLSAVDPPRMKDAVAKVVACIRPGGFLLFRDYAELDHAQIRFSPEQRLGLNHYVRHDGTRTFFFSLEGLSWLMEETLGLECVEAANIRRVVVNRQKDLRMRRIFVNAIYRVPSVPAP